MDYSQANKEAWEEACAKHEQGVLRAVITPRS